MGIKPKVMILGDVEYPNLIHEGKPIAMAYGRLPHFGLLVDPLFTAIVFENAEKGRECFQHFKNWTKASPDREAVSLSFIEANDGSYIVCVYPDFESLIDRCVVEHMRNEITPLVMVPISFPLTVDSVSEKYLFFRKYASDHPILFCCGSKEGAPFLDLAIQKRKVCFFKESELSDNMPEKAYFRMKSAKPGQHTFEREPPTESSGTISKRRNSRLRRFLPITLEELEYIRSFKNSRISLEKEGFADWQILQAACNLVVSFRLCSKSQKFPRCFGAMNLRIESRRG